MVGNRIPVRDIYVGIYLTKYLLQIILLSIEKSRELINAEAGILLLDDTINYLRRTGKIKYAVSVRRYN